MSGNVNVTPQADGTYTGSITLTIDGNQYSGTFILKPTSTPTNPNIPNPPTLAVGAPSQTSISITVTPPSSGPALDQGNFRVNYKAHTATTWTNAYKIPYCTRGKGTITDTKANKWTLNTTGNPVVNGNTDTASHATMLVMVGGTVWQVDTSNEWYSVTPTGTINSGSIAWSGPTTTQPMTNLSIGGLAANTAYDLQATVSNGAGNSHPASAAATTAATSSGGGTGGTGPDASSQFITVACDKPFNYPRGSGQQYVSQRMYGVGTGGAGDGNFGIFNDATFRQLAGQVNPGLWMFKDSGWRPWNNDLSINASVMAPLVNNFCDVDPLGISGVLFSINWNMVPGGQGNPNQYAKGMESFARYLKGAKMKNGKPFPLLGLIGWDEPDSQGEDAVAAYYNAFAPLVKAVSQDILICGPQCSYIQWTDFANKVPLLDVLSYNYFAGGGSRPWNDMSWIGNNAWASIAQNAANAPGNLKATMMAGYGLDWNCSSPADNSYPGALFAASGFIDSLNNAKVPFWPCKWDAFSDGTCGVFTGPAQAGQYYGVTNEIRITPKGYFAMEGVHKLYGPRLQVSANSSGLKVLAVSPGPGRIGVMVLNETNNAKSGTVAMSKWPVNSSGDDSANVWQMDSSVTQPGTDGKRSNIQVNKGVTGQLNFPGSSVTIISVGAATAPSAQGFDVGVDPIGSSV